MYINTRGNKSTDELLGEVANEFFQLLNQGDCPNVEDYAKRYPEIAEQVRLIFPALELVGSDFSGSVSSTLGSSAPDRLGCTYRFGDFQIVREIGRGGMGVVYEAHQHSMGRQVALKVLPFASLVDETRLRRFKNEVRAVATLEHPNIVSVYSIGEERGVHYYAMRLIRGPSLAEVIQKLAELENKRQSLDGDSISRLVRIHDPNQPSTASAGIPAEELGPVTDRETKSLGQTATTEPNLQSGGGRLTSATPSREFYRNAAALGIQAASALAHAHENGVLHRDIKPANLLLDANGNVYLTDFGLARIEADTGVTMTGQLIGTLRYMSPEQALLKRAAIDHRSDIYSLGVTLYELLALQPAFRSSSRREILAQIAFEEPAKLRRLARSIPAELETIIAKAIEKSPEDRYASAAELADDLRAFLDDRPITARPPTLVHQFSKWSRRNRGLVASAAVASCVCLVLLIVSNILFAGQKALAEKAAEGERNQRIVAEGERDTARLARDQAEDVTKFMLDTFGSTHPDEDGHSVTVAEVLDRAVDKLEDQFDNEPKRKMALIEAIAKAYRGLGLSRSAIPLFEQTLQFRREHLGPQHRDTLSSINNLAMAYSDVGLDREALELHEQSVMLTRKVEGERHPDTLGAMQNLAWAYMTHGRHAEAIVLHEQTLKLKQEVLGERHPSTLGSMAALAASFNAVGRFTEAIEFHEMALKYKREVLGERHSSTLVSMGNLAQAYKGAGRFPEAVELFEQAFKLAKEVLGERHTTTLTTMSSLAVAYANVARWTEAVALFEQTLQLKKEVLGESDRGTLTSMMHLATAYSDIGRFSEAIELLEQAVAVEREVRGERHPATLAFMLHLANVYKSAGQYAEAVDLHEQALELHRKVLGERHPMTLDSMESVAVVYGLVSRAEEALKLHEQTLTLRRKVLGQQHFKTLESMNYVANCFLEHGRYQDAVELHKQVLTLKVEVLGTEHPLTLTSMANLGAAYLLVGRNEEAVQLGEKALNLRRKIFGDRHTETLSSMDNLAVTYREVGRHPEAVELQEQTLQLKQEVLGEKHPDTLSSMINLARAYGNTSRFQDALQLNDQLLPLCREVFGDRHANTLTMMGNLVNDYQSLGRYPEAIELSELLLQLKREKLGERHSGTLNSMRHLADNFSAVGRYQEAIELIEHALELKNEVLGPWHPSTLSSINSRARIYLWAGRYTEASKLYDEAIEFFRNPPAESLQDSDTIAKQYSNVLAFAAETCLRLEEPEKAESLARESMQLRERLAPEKWARFHSQALLGSALLEHEKFDEAELHLLAGFAGMLERKETIPAISRVRLREACQALVDLYQSNGKADQAEQWTRTLADLP